jgi:hypothetical protein
MNAAAQLAMGFVSGYVIASLIESFMHQHVSDAPYKTVRLWERYPRLFKYFIRTRYSHHVIHHCRTFKRDFVTQFRNQGEHDALDAELRQKGAHGKIILDSHYAVKLHGSGALVFVVPLLPAAVLVDICFSTPVAIGATVALSLPPILSNSVHRYLHMPHAEAVAQAPWFISLLLRTWYFRSMARNHYMHHRYVASNFNLLLGGDILRRKYRRPAPADLVAMEQLGIAVS